MPYRRPSDGIYLTNFQIDGQRYRRTTGTTKLREAERFERELRAQIEREKRAGIVAKFCAHTFEEALLRWLDEGAPESMYGHIRIIRGYIAPTTPLESVHREATSMATKMRKEGLAARTINNRLACVRRMLNLAYRRWEWLDRPTAEKIGLESERNSRRMVTINFARLRSLTQVMTRPAVGHMCMIAAFSGARRSELFGAEPKDWRIERHGDTPVGILSIRHSKGGEPREIPIPTPLHPIMERLPLPVSPDQLRYQFDRARALCDMPWLQYRDLRHCYASWVGAEPGTRAAMLRDLMGHSDIRTTDRYMHSLGGASQVVEGLFERLAAELADTCHMDPPHENR